MVQQRFTMSCLYSVESWVLMFCWYSTYTLVVSVPELWLPIMTIAGYTFPQFSFHQSVISLFSHFDGWC